MSAAALTRGRTGDERAAEIKPFSRLGLGLLVLAVLAEFALLALWQRNGYWDFSDGVYAQSARELLHGLVPYRDFAAAQPPPVYLIGGLLLAIHDGLSALRAGMALLDLATAVLVGIAVWRLSRRRWLAAGAVLAAPLLPISLHEHAQLLPESLAAPLLLAGALMSSRHRRAVAGGLLLALAVWCKLAFALPAVAIAIAAPPRRTSLLTLALGCLALAAVSLALFGTDVWRESVQAQLQLGLASFHDAGGELAQVAWSEVVLGCGAFVAVSLWWSARAPVADPALMRTLTAAAAAGLVLALTVFKLGSYLNVLVVAEPPLLALALCGAAWSGEKGVAHRLVVAVLGGLLALQSASILTSPGAPWAAKRPGAQSGLEWSASPDTVDHDVAAARRCPAGVAYSGHPYFAFLANRRMPGNQPDLFILGNAPVDRAFAQEAARDQPRCP